MASRKRLLVLHSCSQYFRFQLCVLTNVVYFYLVHLGPYWLYRLEAPVLDLVAVVGRLWISDNVGVVTQQRGTRVGPMKILLFGYIDRWLSKLWVVGINLGGLVFVQEFGPGTPRAFRPPFLMRNSKTSYWAWIKRDVAYGCMGGWVMKELSITVEHRITRYHNW